MKRLSVMSLAALALSSAIAAEVVVYAPDSAGGFTVKAPSGTYHYDKSFTGHRAVITIPDPTNAVLEAWTGNAGYSVGAAYGTSAARDYPAVDLTRLSPVMPRLTLAGGSAEGAKTCLAETSSKSGTSDRALTIAEYLDKYVVRPVTDADYVNETILSNDLKNVAWIYTNKCRLAAVDATSLSPTRVRLVRWVVDGKPVYNIGVESEAVFDKRILLSDGACLTEADVLADGDFDLDWVKMKSDVVDWTDSGILVTNVGYLVVIGDGRTGWQDDLDSHSAPAVCNFVVERRFGQSRAVPTPLSATFDGTVAQFKFRIDGDDVYDDETPSFTAFQVGVRAKGASSAVWTSGVRRLPAKMQDAKVYSYVTDDAALASAIASGKSYEWVCAIYNAKFSDTPVITDTNTWSSATLTVK